MVGSTGAFGVGLRLAAEACDHLLVGPAQAPAAELVAVLAELGMYVFTLNGFPYGAFHGVRVKENVYRPDWIEEERVRYTGALARVLAAVLPAGQTGSISTVPGCFRPRGEIPHARAVIAHNLVRAVADLVGIDRAQDRRIVLALEPEPHALLETSQEAVAFFERDIWNAESVAWLAAELRVDRPNAERLLRQHLGVCLDACHASVEFERPLAALRRLRQAGIAVPKLQISAGLRIARADPEILAHLGAFAEDTYLHQVIVRSPSPEQALGKLDRFVDLPDALARASDLPAGAEWRVHFHVPVFETSLGPFSSTGDELGELLREAAPDELPEHLEVETYTFGVLPERYRRLSLPDALARELAWTRQQLGAAAP
jgi:hypothetical protein